MPIPVTCGCGRSLRARDEAAGRKVRCPGCSAVLAVPKPDANPDPEDEALNILMSVSEKPPAAAPKRAKAAEYDEDESEDDPQDEPDDEPDEESLVRRRPTALSSKPPPPPKRSADSPRRKSRSRREKSRSGGFSIAVHPSIITGLLMMGGAALWFFVGLAAGRIFFYPPVLFVLGIGAIIRGFRGED